MAFGCSDPTLGSRTAQRFRLVEKGRYQSLYGADGKVDRLLHDRNGDGIADALIRYAPTGQIRQAELDTDLDGVIDRWEYFQEGTLIRLGSARLKPGTPDYWERLAMDGALLGREYDDNGDGAVDRVEPVGIQPK
jgi:hypothetical protein